jgi:hypothetical protein
MLSRTFDSIAEGSKLGACEKFISCAASSSIFSKNVCDDFCLGEDNGDNGDGESASDV